MSLIRKFLFEGLNSFDKEALSSMGVADFFHSNVNWYGPGGIGACFSLKEFQSYHQQHWLTGFPDRKVQDLDSLFARVILWDLQVGQALHHSILAIILAQKLQVTGSTLTAWISGFDVMISLSKTGSLLT